MLGKGSRGRYVLDEAVLLESVQGPFTWFNLRFLTDKTPPGAD